MLKQAIARLTLGDDLSPDETMAVMGEIMDGRATPAQIGGFLAALRLKRESFEEILGCAQALRQKALRLDLEDMNAIDLCGTGGDGARTFNVSTASCFVIAGAGVPVAKHGNRSVSSRCGSADLVESLGIRLDMGPDEARLCLRETGIAFLFAPFYHGALKHASTPRRDLGIPTIFNIVGPLCNPAFVKAQVVGTSAAGLTEVMARVLDALGTRHSLVVHSLDGLDEISAFAPTRVSEVKDGHLRTYLIDPSDIGFSKTAGAISVDDVSSSQETFLSVLRGERSPARDMVLLNAAAGLLVSGAVENLREGVLLAKHSLDKGAALEKLELLKRFSKGDDR